MFNVKRCSVCPYKAEELAEVGMILEPLAANYLCGQNCPEDRSHVINTGMYPRERVREPHDNEKQPYAGSPSQYLW